MKAPLRSVLALLLVTSACGSVGPKVKSSAGKGTNVTVTQGLDTVVFGVMEVRDRQRLARDLYDYFARKYVDSTFRIARDTRGQHLALLARVLRQRDALPAVPAFPAGEFDDPALQAEFDRLRELGDESLLGAARVGALLEERDIAFVRARAAETSAADVTAAYARLERTGRRHLWTFVTRLRTQGEDYQPEHMKGTDFQALVESRNPRDAER